MGEMEPVVDVLWRWESPRSFQSEKQLRTSKINEQRRQRKRDGSGFFSVVEETWFGRNNLSTFFLINSGIFSMASREETKTKLPFFFCPGNTFLLFFQGKHIRFRSYQSRSRISRRLSKISTKSALIKTSSDLCSRAKSTISPEKKCSTKRNVDLKFKFVLFPVSCILYLPYLIRHASLVP